MAINLDFYEHIRGVLGDELDEHYSLVEILAMAADWMSGQHAWRFLLRPVRLQLRGKTTVADATYTHATRTLTLASAFDDYAFVPGDTLEASAGTGVTAKAYPIESRTSGSAIVLASPGLGAAADAAADVDGTIRSDRMVLPADFLDFPSAQPFWTNDQIAGGITFTDLETLTQRRAGGLEVDATWAFMVALQDHIDPATGNSVPVLEHFPAASAARADAFIGTYRARILIDQTDEEAPVPIPSRSPLFAAVLKKACRAFALGLEEGEEAGKPSLEELLRQLTLSDLWMAAKRMDGRSQPTVGPLRGGVGSARSRVHRTLSTQVEGPT